MFMSDYFIIKCNFKNIAIDMGMFQTVNLNLHTIFRMHWLKFFVGTISLPFPNNYIFYSLFLFTFYYIYYLSHVIDRNLQYHLFKFRTNTNIKLYAMKFPQTNKQISMDTFYSREYVM